MDITMCDGKECPMKENCYRFTATPNKFRQSYFMKAPVVLHITDGESRPAGCHHFWNNEEYRK